MEFSRFLCSNEPIRRFFERELASLVALQVLSSKEEGEEEENFFDKFQ